MTWLQRYRVRHYISNSIWIWPLLSMVAAIGAVRFLHWTDERIGWESPLDPDTARAVLGTMAASMFTFIVFVFTFTFSLAALVRITTAVPLLTAHLAAYSCLASLAFFLYLIDHVGKALRPSGALWAVAWLGR